MCCLLSYVVVLNCVLHLSIFSFFTKSANLTLAKEHLIQEVAKIEGTRVASAVPEEAGASADPVSKAPRRESCSSLDSAFEEILQERQSQARSVSSTSAEVQVQTYLSEQTTPKMIHFSTGKNMLISSPPWLLLQPSISVPPAALWTVRDFLVLSLTSLMRKEQAQT